MKKNLVLLLMIFLILSMGLTGCGGGDTDQAQDDQSGSAGEAVEEDAKDTAIDGMGDLLSTAFVDIMKGGEYLMEYKFTMDFNGQPTVVESTLAKKGDETAVTSNMPDNNYAMIFKEDKMYMVDHGSKTVMVTAQQNKNAASEKSGSVNMEGITYLGNGNEDGLVYEEYSTSDGTIKYYFSGKDLVKMAVTASGQTMVMEILKLSKDVPASMFEIPSDYEVIEM